MNPKPVILLLSLPLVFMIIVASLVGLRTPDFYSAETPNWQVQSIGQDWVDLILIAPSLLITSILAHRNNKVAHYLWGGLLLYSTYTFTLYCFDVHFNTLFILYCLCLGLSFYSFIYFLYLQLVTQVEDILEFRTINKITGTYFIIISVLFYFLWLAEIIPAIIQKIIPRSIVDVGLFTNGVHVLDLSIILPMIFMTGVLLLKKKQLGFTLAPVILMFFILMDITIGTLVVMMNKNGIQSDLTLTGIMGLLALFSLYLLIVFFRSNKALTT